MTPRKIAKKKKNKKVKKRSSSKKTIKKFSTDFKSKKHLIKITNLLNKHQEYRREIFISAEIYTIWKDDLGVHEEYFYSKTYKYYKGFHYRLFWEDWYDWFMKKVKGSYEIFFTKCTYTFNIKGEGF